MSGKGHVQKYEHKHNNRENKPKESLIKMGKRLNKCLSKNDIEMTNMCMTEVRHH